MSAGSRDGKGEEELWELARLFTKLGFIAFGGPAAHIAMMRYEVVEGRGWLSEREFLDLNGAANLISGPNSTELAIHIGRERGQLEAGNEVLDLAIGTTRIFRFSGVRWRQLHYHGSIDQPDLLTAYQEVVEKS
jgi:hypothetical protein